MLDKKLKRKRRATKTRANIRRRSDAKARLCVGRSNSHLYAQIIISDEKGDKVLASASTLDKEVKAAGANSNNVKSAMVVGNVIAKRAIAAGITSVAFDRSGFKYHGCIKALADAAREAELSF